MIPTQSALVPVKSVFGWIVIQQRLGFTFDYDLPWADYKVGFGSIDADFWLGLEAMHLLTSSQPYQLRVEVLREWNELWYSAEYWSFRVGDELDKYRLELAGYSGDWTDALIYEGDNNDNGKFGNYIHNGMQFTTNDQDNDPSSLGNCAVRKGGGWWFNRCFWACFTCSGNLFDWDKNILKSRMMIKPQ